MKCPWQGTIRVRAGSRAAVDAAGTRIVWRGLTGRFALAIEPLIGTIFMVLLTWGIVYRAQHVASDATLIKIAWIFALGAIAFGGYFVAVLVAPVAAYLQTFRRSSSSTVTCAIASRTSARAATPAAMRRCSLRIARSPASGNGSASGRCPNATIPALVEFSAYAGIQDRRKTDGRTARRRTAAARDRHRHPTRQADDL